jgi:aspartate carbamoyltransferase catalytic subunit
MSEILLNDKRVDYSSVLLPIENNEQIRHLLSIDQISVDGFYRYLREAYAGTHLQQDGIDLLRRKRLMPLMRQPSTRTSGSFAQAMIKLGGASGHYGGSEASSEAKEETRYDSEEALGVQVDIYAVRTEEEMGPAFAAKTFDDDLARGDRDYFVPVINAGDGTNEHPTQTIGDFYTIHRHFGQLEGLKVAVIGDYEKYRAHHSTLKAIAKMGMKAYVLETKFNKIPEDIKLSLGDNLINVKNLDDALVEVDVLDMGRFPKEYKGSDKNAQKRYEKMAKYYREKLMVDKKRLKIMPKDSIAMHPRPKGPEYALDCYDDSRMKDVRQMYDMVPARMGIIILHMGKSMVEALEDQGISCNNPLK